MEDAPFDHECDLFLLTSHIGYSADRSLPEFARRGARNIDGWGMGFYLNGQARVLRSEQPALGGSRGRGDVSREFALAVDAVASPVVLGHLRLTSSGSNRVENNHPFHLNFLGYEWLLIHNGHSPRHRQLVPTGERLLTESDNDTPRVFEFLRAHMIDYLQLNRKGSLIEACRTALADLLNADPGGKFNLILTNGYLSFALVHWRSFYLLRREKGDGNATLLSTIQLTDDEYWIEFRWHQEKAKLLVFSGPTLVLNSDIPSGSTRR